MARPFERLPAGAKAHLERMAENGLLSESAAAIALGMPLKELKRVIKEHKPSQEIWSTCLSIERDRLLGIMYEKAKDGDTKAGQYLLAVRHGLSEKVIDSNPGDRVQITFQLPAALNPDQFTKLVQNENAKLTDNSDTSTERATS